jgi:hypoxanthine phosphoribosyltransferase
MIPEDAIRRRVAELGAEVSRAYAGHDLLLVSILKGAIVFLSDLMRSITTPHEIDFLSVSSYGNRTHSSGHVRLLHDLSLEISGRHVLLVEDIVDTGGTLAYLMDYLRLRSAASLKICALVEKQVPVPRKVEADFVGFRVPNRFVIGYGMDLAGHYRHLPFIGAIAPATAAEFAGEDRI